MSANQESNSNLTYCVLSKELEALKDIYLDELVEQTNDEENTDPSSEKFTKFAVTLFPSTADNISEQYVKLTLNFTVPEKYPDSVPNVEIKSARGLSQEKVQKLQERIENMANEKKGSNMLYDLINYAKESLTTDNFPSGPCMVCLYEFTKDDIYVVTKCFHHFHSRCLANYIEKGKDGDNKETKSGTSGENLMPCPVCRDNSDLTHLVSEPANSYPPPTLSQKPLTEEKSLLEEAKQQQEKFASIYEKQQEKGGIIDLEAEKNRFLIKISNTDESSNNNNTSNNDNNNTDKTDNTDNTDNSNNNEVSTNSFSSEYHSSDETKPHEGSIDKKVSKNGSKKLDGDNGGPSGEDDKDLSKSSSSKKKSSPSNDSAVTKDESDNDSQNNDNEEEKVNDDEKNKNEVKEDKENNPTSSRRSRSTRGKNRKRARSRQGQMSNVTNTDEMTQNGGRRSRSRRVRNRSNYSRSYNRGQVSRNFSGRARNRNRYNTGGLASPPYRRNFGSFSYNEKNYQDDNGRDHDRPGYYVARVFRPGNQNRNTSKSNDSKNSTSPKGTGSELTDEQGNRPQSINANRKSRRNGNQNQRNKRYNSENDYQNGNMHYQNTYQHQNIMQGVRKPRQNYQQNYRTQNTWPTRNYGYYNTGRNMYGHYQNYNALYGTGYSAGYGYDMYNYSYNNYSRTNYGHPRVIYRSGSRNYQPNGGYRQRKRNDKHETRKNEVNINDGQEFNN